MGYQKGNRKLFIDNEAVSTLALLKEKILLPCDKLMNKKESLYVDKYSKYKNQLFPFSFILAPSGKRNAKVLQEAKKGDTLDLICEKEKKGEIVVDEIFKINKEKRIKKIFTTTDLEHPGVKDIYKRLGDLAISGEFEIDSSSIKKTKQEIKKAKELIKATKTTAIVLSGKPLHRAHERMIRMALEKSDLVVLFLLKPFKKDIFSYEIRYKALKYFTDNFLPKNKVLIVPLENSYLFAGYNNIILDSIVTKNFGCDSIAIGQNHSGIGLYYEKDSICSTVKNFKNIGIDIDMVNEFVYCNECRTLVSTRACPHGSHHHISYNAKLIAELYKVGVLPPAVLVRKEISAIILSELFPNRIKYVRDKFANFFPNSGLIETKMNDREFYMQIMNLHQTTSLT